MNQPKCAAHFRSVPPIAATRMPALPNGTQSQVVVECVPVTRGTFLHDGRCPQTPCGIEPAACCVHWVANRRTLRSHHTEELPAEQSAASWPLLLRRHSSPHNEPPSLQVQKRLHVLATCRECVPSQGVESLRVSTIHRLQSRTALRQFLQPRLAGPGVHRTRLSQPVRRIPALTLFSRGSTRSGR